MGVFGSKQMPSQPPMADITANASVAITTSLDDRNPPSNILDGVDRSFWATGGLYPQEFMIQLDQSYQISSVKLLTAGVRTLGFESRDGNQNNSEFIKVTQEAFENVGSQQQLKEITVKGVKASQLRFVIESGWGDFCAVYKCQIFGSQ